MSEQTVDHCKISKEIFQLRKLEYRFILAEMKLRPYFDRLTGRIVTIN